MSKANIIGLAALLAGIAALASIGSHSVTATSLAREERQDEPAAKINPAAPKRDDTPVTLPATVSHLSLKVTFPKAAIQAQLEKAIPKEFPVDEDRGFRTYGKLTRGALTVTIDPVTRRISATAGVSGKVQVEKRIEIRILGQRIVSRPSVGIDVSGNVTASVSPVVGPKWDVNPQLDLSPSLNRAAARTPFGDVEITGLVRGAVGRSLNGAKANVEAKLKEALNLRARCEQLWKQIASVQKLSDAPTTWAVIVPRRARTASFQHTRDAIVADVGLDLEVRVVAQPQAPPIERPPLPDLKAGGNPSDDFELTLPVDVSHEAVNLLLKEQLKKSPMKLPNDASLTVTDASIEPYEKGIVLVVDFHAAEGPAGRSAAGRLYVTGEAILDEVRDELRVRNLAFTTDTLDSLKEDAEWLRQADPIKPMSEAAVIKLGDEIKKAKQEANEQLARLKDRLSKDFEVNLTVTELHVSRLAFAGKRVFAVVTAKGKMSAVLKP
jgi:hypothetical protein